MGLKGCKQVTAASLLAPAYLNGALSESYGSGSRSGDHSQFLYLFRDLTF